ncbi:MAG: phosphoglucosamine mutase [Bacteroidetes Order II. Incertae sedis bacterium]|jgi:phosphomannomutase|nr:phosphoglucosamine mutase [Bacteroidetes Order II. bacterium]MBT4052158.1 phosphoglucosamine mutase [Bacteroidetes Order II. bacterium]MBT5248887.1 phosphoglucosamine mutase [Bacteroidetes Order II. bacterium]MBT6199346.1 phosphoglucosamine mutase [Bacteroidetes Order II. bacterium]MBT6424341.1 phosphoglucosamine mutase [Bacteroidetes Order II. bacterium]
MSSTQPSTLVVSISGIRGIFGRGLDPAVIVKYASAYGDWILKSGHEARTVIVGRDARVTGPICSDLVISTLLSQGISVVDAGLATTPTVEMAVLLEKASGGIVLSASHNPAEWNALKLLNSKGEFLSPTDASWLIDHAEAAERTWATYEKRGVSSVRDYLDYHIEEVIGLVEIHPEQIKKGSFKVVVDAVNSVGGIAIPRLLEKLGVESQNIVELHCEPTGLFAHPAEPLPENLTEICDLVKQTGADLGIVVDPDADRLALIADGGVYVSEELTQVLAADFWWQYHSGPFATNLSSSRAIELVAAKYGQEVYRSAVGEINVVEKMKACNAAIGGEGNGGVILPQLHYGRDALIGTALILQHLVQTGKRLSELIHELPNLEIVKMKTDIGSLNPDDLLQKMAAKYASERISTIDGVKIDFDAGWVHMRKSNTEPIIRVYAEAQTAEEAKSLGERFMGELLA